MAKSANIGSMSVTIRADTNPFTRAIRQLQGEVKSFTGTLKSSLGGINKWWALIGGAGLGASIANISSNIDDLAKTSRKLGMSASKLQGLREAAEMSGVGVSTLDMALQRMVRRVSEAALGTGEAQGALRELGIDAKTLNDLSPDQQLGRIADALAGVGKQSDRVRLAFKLFDSEGVSLVQMLAGGNRALQEMAGRLEAIGLSIDDNAVKVVEQANDQWTRFKNNIYGFGTTAIQVLGPYFNWFGEMVNDTIESVAYLIKLLDDAARYVNGLGQRMRRDFAPFSYGSNLTGAGVGRVASAAGRQIGMAGTTAGQLGNAGLSVLGQGLAGARGLIRRGMLMSLGIGLNPDMTAGRPPQPTIPGSASVSDIFGPLRAMLGLRGAFSGAGGLMGRASNGLFGMLRRGSNPAMPATGSIGAVDANSREGFAQRVRAMRDDPLLKIQRDALRELKGIHKGVMAFGGMEAANF